MFGILVSAFNTALGFLIRGAVIKFVILGALGYVVSWIVETILSKLDISSLTGLQSLVSALPPSLVFFLGVFRLDIGLPLVLGAMLTSFIIRRIPFIG